MQNYNRSLLLDINLITKMKECLHFILFTFIAWILTLFLTLYKWHFLLVSTLQEWKRIWLERETITDSYILIYQYKK